MMQGITALPGAPQGPQGMPQGGMQPPPQQQQGQNPAAMTGGLEKLPPQQLLAMFGDPMDKTPKWAVVSAYAKAVENQRMINAVKNQSAVQQAQAQGQMPVAAQVMSQPMPVSQPELVMARNGGVMSGYAGGGPLAFSPGGSTAISTSVSRRIPGSPIAPPPTDPRFAEMEKEEIAAQAGLEKLLQQQAQVDPELLRLREEAAKAQQARIARRDARSLDAVTRAQAATNTPLMGNQEAFLRMVGAGAGAKRVGDLLGQMTKEAGAIRGEQRKVAERAQELRLQEQNALDTLNAAEEEKKIAARNNDVTATRAAELKIQESRNQLLATKRELFKLGEELTLKKRGATAEEIKATAATEQARAAMSTANRPERETDLRFTYNVELKNLLASGQPDNDATRKAALDAAVVKLSKSAGSAKAELQERISAFKEFNEFLWGASPAMREIRKLRVKDPAAAAKKLDEARAQIEARYKVDIKDLVEAAPMPWTPAAPAAPAASAPGTPTPPVGYKPD